MFYHIEWLEGTGKMWSSWGDWALDDPLQMELAFKGEAQVKRQTIKYLKSKSANLREKLYWKRRRKHGRDEYYGFSAFIIEGGTYYASELREEIREYKGRLKIPLEPEDYD